MICRASMIYFDESPSELERETCIEKRIETVVSDVLSLKNLPRKEVQIDTCLDSEEDLTDDEY